MCRLHSGLGNVRHVSLNATSAAHIHSNIRGLIEESERLATDALGTVKEASAVRKAPHVSLCLLFLSTVVRWTFREVLKQRGSGLNVHLSRFFSGGILSSRAFAFPACLVTQSYLTLCDLVGCSPPGSLVHEISQSRILEWAAIPFSVIYSNALKILSFPMGVSSGP